MERATSLKTFHTPTLRDRDASFSSYLLPEKPITCQPHHHPHHNHHTTTRCRSALDDSTSELSIFDAHKYFNEVTNNDIHKVTISSSNSRVSPVVVNMDNERINSETTRYSSASSSVDGYAANIRNYRARSFHAATPTASSEASWNSQQGLLSHPPGAISVSMKNPPNPNPNNLNNNNLKASISKPIWLFRRRCPCTGKKSVQVKEKKTTPEPKTPTPPPPQPQPQPQSATQDHENRMNMETNQTTKHVHNHITVTPNNNWVNQTPNLVATKLVTTLRVPFNDGFTFPVLNPPTTKLRIQNGVVEEDPPRDSLEVFRPPDEEPKPINFPFPPANSRGVAVVEDDGDGASDASSDLFEIESFSTATQSTYPMIYRRSSRDSFDEGSATPAMTECYEPSEASIEWSVTTAEGYEESIVGGGGGVTATAAAEQLKRKGGNGLLVSCRCEKAVSVGPQPVKCGATGTSWRHVSVNGGGGNSSRVGSVNKPPLAARSNRSTPRVSLAFAT